MTRFTTGATAAGALLVMSSVVQAADLPPRYKAPAYTSPAGYSWAGYYVGANLGYHFGKDATSTTTDPTGWGAGGAAAIDSTAPGSASPKGFIGGLQAGYNWQFGNFVAGVEADVNFMSGSASRSVTKIPVIISTDVFTTSAQTSFLATVRPRLGYAVWDRGLFYGTAGLAIARLKFSDSFGAIGNTSVASVDTTKTKMGWAIGAGFEYGFSQAWTVRIEYLYADLGSSDTQIPSCSLCAAGSDIAVHHKYTDNIVRLGVNYRF